MSKEVKPRRFSLTEEEKSDYFFYFRLLKEWQLMAEFWQNKVNWVRVAAMKRSGLDPEKVKTDWGQTLEDGTFSVTQNEHKLQEKQIKGIPAKK